METRHLDSNTVGDVYSGQLHNILYLPSSFTSIRLKTCQNQDQRWDRERVDTSKEARKASKSSPCSSGKSASSEPGGPWNKGSVSCLQAISSGTQSMTAELAMTSKIPHRGEAPLASRSFLHRLFQGNKVHPAPLASTHGEASKQTQSQDILKRKNKMKHLFNITNIEEIIDSERPSSAETLDNFLGGTTTVPHLSTFDILSSESEEEEADIDSLGSRQDTYGESDVITFPRTVSQSSLASTSLSRSTHSLHSLRSSTSQLSTSTISGEIPDISDIYSLTSLLEQTRQPHVAPLPPTSDRVNRGFVACTQRTHQHLPSSTSEQLDNLNVDDMMTLSDIEELVHIQECQAAQGGATAAQNAQSLQDSNKEIVCRPKQRLLVELPNEEEEGQCRICHSGDSSPTNPLLSPCLCSGSLLFIHLDCLKKWIQTRIQSGSLLYVVQRCEICLGRLTLDPDTFDLDDYYRRHHEEQQVSQQMDMTELYRLLEEAIELQESTNRLLLSRDLGPALVTPSCPDPWMRIWQILNQISMSLRRIRERRNPPTRVT